MVEVGCVGEMYSGQGWTGFFVYMYQKLKKSFVELTQTKNCHMSNKMQHMR